ncbi:MAG: 2-oxo-4-hydroxy-4-carboxy-5-ureidoimidazoline decarboxylase, partial [Rubrobacter sp.]
MPEKLTVEEASNLDREGFVNTFGSLYEGSPWVAEGAWRERPFGDLSEMHAAFVRIVREAPPERRLGLIRAHPDLAGKAAVAGRLTPESAREQASAGLDRLSPEEYETFTRLNDAYKEKFGFPMIFAVRDHTRETILSGAEARLGNSRPEEVETALAEIARIGFFRLQELVWQEPDEGRGQRVSGGEIVLGQNNYGKTEIRLVKAKRASARHELWDLDVRVVLEGDFRAAHVEGDNTNLPATDTMRNTVYALAKDHLTGSIEDFGLMLVDHFLEVAPTIERCRVEIVQFPWDRIEVNGHGHDHSFVRGRGERRAKLSGDDGGGRRVEAGIGDLYV